MKIRQQIYTLSKSTQCDRIKQLQFLRREIEAKYIFKSFTLLMFTLVPKEKLRETCGLLLQLQH